MRNEFNSEMVQLARESRGWTQAELAKQSGLTQGFLSKLEAGEKHVSDDKLASLSRALGYPPTFFFQKDSYAGFGMSLVYYRKKASTKVRDLQRLQAEKNIRRMQCSRILAGVDITSTNRFEFMDIDDYNGNVEHIARLVRANWRLPMGPIRNLVAAIEGAGGIVFSFDFGTRDIDALSEWPEKMPPLFCLNNTAPADRARFSLAHELGHIVMHRSASETIESEADRFAAEFLMPANEIASQLDHINLRRAAALKRHWRVSMAAIIMRARDLRRIPADHYTRLFRKMSHLGYRKREPEAILPEYPKLLQTMIEVYESSNGFGLADLARMFCIHEDELRYYLPSIRSLKIA
jgi:Zn-dependent peptidase ImmA (M78 family)/DNA-binding XRE family transcriptional regulator